MQYINSKIFQWFYRGKHCEGKKNIPTCGNKLPGNSYQQKCYIQQ